MHAHDSRYHFTRLTQTLYFRSHPARFTALGLYRLFSNCLSDRRTIISVDLFVQKLEILRQKVEFWQLWKRHVRQVGFCYLY